MKSHGYRCDDCVAMKLGEFDTIDEAVAEWNGKLLKEEDEKKND